MKIGKVISVKNGVVKASVFTSVFAGQIVKMTRRKETIHGYKKETHFGAVLEIAYITSRKETYFGTVLENKTIVTIEPIVQDAISRIYVGNRVDYQSIRNPRVDRKVLYIARHRPDLARKILRFIRRDFYQSETLKQKTTFQEYDEYSTNEL